MSSEVIRSRPQPCSVLAPDARRESISDDGDMVRSAPVVRRVALLAASAALAAVSTVPAVAHEDDKNSSAADLVRQAIALIVNAPGDVDAIADKVADAGTAKDSAGVDLALVERAREMFAEGDLHQVRALLERSIGAQPHMNGTEPPPILETTPTSSVPMGGGRGDMPGAGDESLPPMSMATGADPGGELIADPLDRSPHLGSEGWALIIASIFVGLLGVALGVRWRPAHRRPV